MRLFKEEYLLNIIESAKNVFDTEIDALKKTEVIINETFEQIVDVIISCKGKIVITGIGKSGHIGRKVAATFSSLGTPAFFLHPAEGLHGDLGMVSSNDVIIAISYSGESDEVIRLLPSLKYMGIKIISITSNEKSTLACNSNIAVVLPKFREACHMNLAPTSSTTAVLVYCDALAVVASKMKDFSSEDFGLFHPAGALGRKLLTRVTDVMAEKDNKLYTTKDSAITSAIIEISRNGHGIVAVVEDNRVIGVITDGDLRRCLEKQENIYQKTVSEIMSISPICISEDKLAVDALTLLKQKNISAMPVVDKNDKYMGIVTLQSILKSL